MLYLVSLSCRYFISAMLELFFPFQAEELIVSQKLDKEYLPISGNAEFCKEAIKLALGDNHPAIADGLVCILELLFSPFFF